jgi:digeranylgeranylglycerophospholipid reductase
MKDDYDIILVGAGPAGSVAAQNAAAESDVLLVEKRQEIGAPVRRAEAVPPVEAPLVFHTSFEKYVKPNRKWVASEVKGVRATAPDGATVEVSGVMLRKEEPLGIILERNLFDRQLAKDAVVLERTLWRAPAQLSLFWKTAQYEESNLAALVRSLMCALSS